MASTSEQVERIQSVLDDQFGHFATDYNAFGALMDSLAKYAAAKGWDFMEEASHSSMVVDNTKAAA